MPNSLQCNWGSKRPNASHRPSIFTDNTEHLYRVSFGDRTTTSVGASPESSRQRLQRRLASSSGVRLSLSQRRISPDGGQRPVVARETAIRRRTPKRTPKRARGVAPASLAVAGGSQDPPPRPGPFRWSPSPPLGCSAHIAVDCLGLASAGMRRPSPPRRRGSRGSVPPPPVLEKLHPPPASAAARQLWRPRLSPLGGDDPSSQIYHGLATLPNAGGSR